MLHIGITGQSGFIGTHLYNFFGLKKDEIGRIYHCDQRNSAFFICGNQREIRKESSRRVAERDGRQD